jgi:hypothetical protein
MLPCPFSYPLPAGSAVTSDVRYLPADEPLGEWRLVLPRQTETEYSVEDRGEHFFITIRRATGCFGRDSVGDVWAGHLCIAASAGLGTAELGWASTQGTYHAADPCVAVVCACRDQGRPNSELLVAPIADPTATQGRHTAARAPAACVLVCWLQLL